MSRLLFGRSKHEEPGSRPVGDERGLSAQMRDVILSFDARERRKPARGRSRPSAERRRKTDLGDGSSEHES